jgi:hypothetical protein
MAAEPGNRRLVSFSSKSTAFQPTLNSIPLHSWSGVRRSVCSPPPTRRPTQNSYTTVRSQIAPCDYPRDLPVPKLNHCFLARHITFSPADRFRICNIFHEPQFLASTCCAVKFAANNWCCGDGETANILLITETFESRELDYGSNCQSFCGIYLDAYDCYQGPLRVEPLRV